MRIGDEVFVRGTIDEIRKDTVIIKNRGGYFGTVEEEIYADGSPVLLITRCEDCTWCEQCELQGYLSNYCGYWERETYPKGFCNHGKGKNC